ncbi:MAG: hypothetical protein RMJ81_09050 [Candidatus Kryptonium sp.]|nr:hypothetical protein [Candidatus Kryptonium sp.]MCX7761784.1 hypothetical protein [Candidatus Kryptonium sp.]MDW8109781.1 hypothetical protein [Candidatus Kryptonium sp.]
MLQRFFLTCLLIVLLYGCDKPRDLITPTHIERVPDVKNLRARVDTTRTGKYLVTLNWEYNDNGNLREWEVYRALRDTAGGKLSLLQPPVRVPSYADSTIPSFAEDSVWVYYKVIPVGYDRFLGKPGVIRITIYKRKK